MSEVLKLAVPLTRASNYVPDMFVPTAGVSVAQYLVVRRLRDCRHGRLGACSMLP